MVRISISVAPFRSTPAQIHVGHDPRLKLRKSGDTIVVLSGGEPGVSKYHRQVLRSLGLYKLGDSCSIHIADASKSGQLRKVRHLIKLLPLTSTAWGVARDLHFVVVDPYAGNLRSNHVRERHVFTDTGFKAERVMLQSGEHIRAEQGRDVFSIHWTSALPVSTVIDALDEQFGRDPRYDGFAFFKPGGRVEGTWAAVSAEVRVRGRATKLFRVDQDEWAVTWRAGIGRLESPSVQLNEVGILGTRYALRPIGRLAVATATAQVGSESEALVQSFSPLLDRYT